MKIEAHVYILNNLWLSVGLFPGNIILITTTVFHIISNKEKPCYSYFHYKLIFIIQNFKILQAISHEDWRIIFLEKTWRWNMRVLFLNGTGSQKHRGWQSALHLKLPGALAETCWCLSLIPRDLIGPGWGLGLDWFLMLIPWNRSKPSAKVDFT